jgi:uncharacterized protein (DUF362 family)
MKHIFLVFTLFLCTFAHQLHAQKVTTDNEVLEVLQGSVLSASDTTAMFEVIALLNMYEVVEHKGIAFSVAGRFKDCISFHLKGVYVEVKQSQFLRILKRVRNENLLANH